MSDRGYSNDPYGYLPPALQNDFIREGHNRYKEPTTGVKDAKKAFVTAKKSGSATAVVSARSAKKSAWAKEHPVLAAKAAARPPGAAGKVAKRAAVEAARKDPESRASERAAKRAPKQEPTREPIRGAGDTVGAYGARKDEE